MKTKNFSFMLLLIANIMLCFTSCRKENTSIPTTLESLYSIYKDGEIDECKYHNETVFEAGYNAYDAGSIIYDSKGNRIGACNYAWGHVDPICTQLQDCIVIYRGHNHISGQPFVDTYGLSH